MISPHSTLMELKFILNIIIFYAAQVTHMKRLVLHILNLDNLTIQRCLDLRCVALVFGFDDEHGKDNPKTIADGGQL